VRVKSWLRSGLSSLPRDLYMSYILLTFFIWGGTFDIWIHHLWPRLCRELSVDTFWGGTLLIPFAYLGALPLIRLYTQREALVELVSSESDVARISEAFSVVRHRWFL